jgi:hypothetical protein
MDIFWLLRSWTWKSFLQLGSPHYIREHEGLNGKTLAEAENIHIEDTKE